MIKLKFSKRYLLLPVLLAVFFFLFYLVYKDIKEQTINEFNKEQLILAETASHGITSFFNDYQSDLAFLSKFKDIIDFTDNSKELMAGFYENHKKFIEAVTRVDANGSIIYTYPENSSLTGKDISYQKHVHQIIATHQPVISDVFMSVQGYLAIAMHVPVFKGKEFRGSLAMLISIDKLGKIYLGKIKIRGTGNVWLLSENGVEIYCPVSGHTGKPFLDNTQNDVSAYKLLEEIRTENSGTAKSIHQKKIFNGEPGFIEKHMAFYRAPLGNTYWTIIISFQEEDIYIVLTRLRNRLILIFSLLFIIISYYFYSLAKARTVLKEEAKRKKTERTLLESEEKFRTIFEESPIGIELYEADGIQKDANRASLNMFGIPDVSEIKKFNLFEGTSLDEEKKDRLRKGKPVAYQAFFDFEKVKALHQYKTNRAGQSYFDYIITPLLNPEGKIIDGYLLQVQDISERKRTEDEILMLAQSLRSVNECVSITDTGNRILFVNAAFSKTYGYSADELAGKHIDILRSTDNPSNFINQILPATLNGEWKGELKNRRKDGSEFPIYLSTTIIKDKNGNPMGLIGVATDITERLRKERELVLTKEKAEESDRLKSAFLANMSHEIRTPMNGILGFAGLLKEPDLTGEEQKKYISIIEKSGARMLNIINDIINISKVESGQMEIFVSETGINEQIEYIFTFFKVEVEQKGLQIFYKNQLPAKEAIIKTDREKILAILTNLVKNAIKFTHEGSIEIGYMLKGEFLEFYVKDSGEGIRQEQREIIFERFRQGSTLNTRNYEGSGLGLSISKAYVEMLGGKIRVESVSGKGSIFYFTIPYIIA